MISGIFHLNNIDDSKELAQKISVGIRESYLKKLDKNLLNFTLKGEMGAGKTTITQEIINNLTGAKEIDSPTFNLVYDYSNNQNIQIWHVDLWRLQENIALLDLGITPHASNFPLQIIFIEWPQKIAELEKELSSWRQHGFECTLFDVVIQKNASRMHARTISIQESHILN